MTAKVACKCGEELTPCVDRSPSSIPCKGWVHSRSNSHVCLTAKGGDIAEPASAPDAGQPVTLCSNLTEPFDKLVDHLQDCCGGCPYCVELCEQVVKEAYAIQQKRVAPSAPASAARHGCTHTLSDRQNAVALGYCPLCTSQRAEELREQTRQLREELANWPKTLCAVTAMGDEETAEEVADFIADMTNTCMERLRFGKEQQQRAQAAEAELKLEQEASATVAENYGRVCDKLKAAEAERDKLLKYARHTGMCFLEQTRREPCNCGWAELERLRKEAK